MRDFFASRWAACLVAALLALGTALAAEAADLAAKYAELLPRLLDNPFQQPFHLEFHEASGEVRGDIYARLDQPYTEVATALAQPAAWCDISILHLNIKYCSASHGQRSIVTVYVGRKFDQPLDKAHRLDFVFRPPVISEDHLAVWKDADKGPFDTRNYRLALRAIPVNGDRSFLHFSYAYTIGLTGRLAMQSYLATLGRAKVGFTVTGVGLDGRPQYVGGMRGAVERNTMRYFLAIKVYLDHLRLPETQRMEKSFHAWFAATEHYPRQLREMELNEYLALKRKEYARQQSPLE